MLIAIQPAEVPAAQAAAPFAEQGAVQTRGGGFFGARLRIPFGGPEAGVTRIGLTAAPVVMSIDDHRRRTRIGEGFELGLRGGGKPLFQVAGRPLSSFASQKVTADTSNKRGISTVGAIAIGVGVVIVVGVIAFTYALNHCPDYADEC